MTHTEPGHLVRQYFAAYTQNDHTLIDRLLAEDFTFTSPYDDRIDRNTYFSRCWPNHEQIRGYRIEKLSVDQEDVQVVYDMELVTGATLRNAELFRTRSGRITEVEVYFGALAEQEVFDEAAIRDLFASYGHAITCSDPDTICAHYHPDIVVFDANGALQFKGVAAYREHWQLCLSRMSGAMIFEIHDPAIYIGGDTAYAHYLCRCGWQEHDSEQITWMRATAGLCRTESGWTLIHEHFSVPFDCQGCESL